MYEITNETYSAKIDLKSGANCVSFINKKYGAHILREKDGNMPPDNPFLYGMPILFPANRISDGKYVFEGRTYTFPINEPQTGCHLHGVLHEQEFRLIEGGTDYMTCVYRATKAQPYLQFPHEFEIVIRYQLTEDGLEQKTVIQNLSQLNMPVMIGFHTTFHVPFMKGQKLEDLRIHADVTDWIERSLDTHLPTGNMIPADEVTEQLQRGAFIPNEQKISRHYKSGDSGLMCIRDEKAKVAVIYRNSANMKFRLLYNGNADEFICLEPQNCLVNCLNAKFAPDYSSCEYLKPGEKTEYLSSIMFQTFG